VQYSPREGLPGRIQLQDRTQKSVQEHSCEELQPRDPAEVPEGSQAGLPTSTRAEVHLLPRGEVPPRPHRQNQRGVPNHEGAELQERPYGAVHQH